MCGRGCRLLAPFGLIAGASPLTPHPSPLRPPAAEPSCPGRLTKTCLFFVSRTDVLVSYLMTDFSDYDFKGVGVLLNVLMRAVT